MKLMSLNIWGGKLYSALMPYIEERGKDTDIFCFQEVFRTDTDITESRGIRANIFSELGKALPDHIGYFSNTQEGYDQNGKVDFHLEDGNAIFVRKGISVAETGSVFVYGTENSSVQFESGWRLIPRDIQYVQLSVADEQILIANLHGLSTPKGKGDLPERIEQSVRVADFLGKYEGKTLLVGDFNLDPNTESMRIIEKGHRNLIIEYGIKTTRNDYFKGESRFADYAIVSPACEILNFEVLNVDLSDHLPLLIEFK